MNYKKILIITVVLILMQTAISTAAMNNTQDKFGLSKIYENDPGGREWVSKWDNGIARSWPHQVNDPVDPEFQNGGKGDGSFQTDGNGILKVSGSTPRMHIADVNQLLNWHDVEITVYFRRVSDADRGDSGMSVYARFNHMIDSDICDTRGYAGEFRFDGKVGFEKEIAHGLAYARAADKLYWPNGMPFNEWLGIKFVVYDLSDGNVKLELYMDETDGANGGTWNKVTEFIDNGHNFGVGLPSCAPGIDPALRLTKLDTRPGSESGKPNLDILFRSDEINTDGFWMKKASIREIVPVQYQDKFINGTVMDSVNKTGLSGVTVYTNTGLSTMTNTTGFYSFAVTAGAYNLTAKFEPTYYSNDTITVSTIENALVVQDIELLKKMTGTITGKVTRT